MDVMPKPAGHGECNNSTKYCTTCGACNPPRTPCRSCGGRTQVSNPTQVGYPDNYKTF